MENDRRDDVKEAAEAPKKNPGLRALEKLVGTWKVAGDTKGQLSYEWLPGGFFLIARGDTEQGGQRTQHIEIIGYDHGVNAVTTWFGEKGSPSTFKAKWIDDDTLSGAWEWPGGGYKLTLSRMKGGR